MSTYYDKGDVAKLRAQWRVPQEDGSTPLMDPGTVTLYVTKPGGMVTTYVYGTGPEITKVSTGIYLAQIPVDRSGRWNYAWDGTTPAIGVEEGHFIVRLRTSEAA